ncbi:protein kinase domain-containing protein [Natranaerobius thermophilus]|uniref:non-specific serine/threonine protein kinase n=1 Tax=Natranaerobius thermophilus (strain ATCC BAA-1301 / DSM 18059 / JW/NM-WN-LF) TaxID=457570 RepID=B2A3Z8_NATTJ|nr:protein kinase [Natranaerobius thermophilus]ACB85100.1 serine/threonine protein kinase [Natranaerobius thermophilus JW/NM-WN-LF]
MNYTEYIKLLRYFDNYLWDKKVGETNYNYNGLILDAYFELSILSIDYLDIEDFFDCNGKFKYDETKLLSEQFKEVKNPDKKLKLIENILNIFNLSSYNTEVSETINSKTLVFLKRNRIMINNFSNGFLALKYNNIVDEGSYCSIIKVHEGILRKELKPFYRENPDFQKRMKYEYENMLKLHDCPYVLNVYGYDSETHSYLMEEADMNLHEYITTEINIPFEQKMKIIYDVLNGMKYAHNHSIIHRDLHLGNILKLRNDFVLCDFGLSKDESIERSLKSSSTEKNNHIFLDPLAIGDFKKLDKKSDIYSLGKVIDYVFTASVDESKSQHLFTFVVEKCTSRNKEKRYETVDQVLSDIELKLKEQNRELDKKKVDNKIHKGIFDMQVSDYILRLVRSDRLCDYLVKHKLYSFGNIIVQFEKTDQINILQTINYGYIDATGFGQFHNYDIFARIAYFVCLNTDESKIFSIAKDILEGCAEYRYNAEDYLDEIEKLNL